VDTVKKLTHRGAKGDMFMNSIVVRVSGSLRKLTGGKTEIAFTAVGNIADCVVKLEEQFPGMREKICDEEGEIRGAVNIYVNGDNVRSLKSLAPL
jgi:molybdopterin synthase sulfur carrier subunit